MKRFSLEAFLLVIGICAPTFGIQVTETFDNDPTSRGWSGVNNMLGVGSGDNNYGFTNTDNTGTAVNPPLGTATAEGEAGGNIVRAPNSFYGVDLGGAVDFATTDMSVSGVIVLPQNKSSSTLNLGWSQGITTVNSTEGDDEPINALFITWDDGLAGELAARNTDFIDSATGPNLVSGGPTRPFTMDWDSATGTFTMDIGGDVQSLVLGADKAELAQMTHWGMWGRSNHDGDDGGNHFFIDDLTYTVPSAAGVPGDYNNNGRVDAADYVLWRNGGPIANEGEDVSEGVVDGADYEFWKSQFGNPAGGSAAVSLASTPVPEPASIVLALAALAMWLPRRNRHPT